MSCYIFKVLSSSGIEFHTIQAETIWIAKANAKAFGTILEYKQRTAW